MKQGFYDVNRTHFDGLYSAADVYAPHELWNRTRRAAAVIRHLRRGDRTILEIGCGDGVVTRMLGSQAPSHIDSITAIDVSAVGIDRARASTHDRRIHYVCGGVESFDGGPYDVVCIFDVLEHLDDPGATLDRIAALLSPSGRVLLSTPNRLRTANRIREWRGRPLAMMDPTHAREFSARELDAMLRAAGFKTVRRWGIVLFVTDWLLAFSNNEGSRSEAPVAASAGSEAAATSQSQRSRWGRRLLARLQRVLSSVEQSRTNYFAGRLVPHLANGIYVLAEKR